MRQWTPEQLRILTQLREGFLSGRAGARDYWRTAEELSLYDQTFAERIGWKWDAVVAELDARGWKPQSRHILEWGCGTGIAGRRLLAAWPSQFSSVTVHDRSRRAMQFAASRYKEEFPTVPVTEFNPNTGVPPDTALVLSHVINELTDEQAESLLRLASKVREILWVDAGTHPDSRRLTTVMREKLREKFVAVAPCTHSERCGMSSVKNAHHWCHHFARVPSHAFQDARWAEFSRELGIDLRVLPYSYIVMESPRETLPTPRGYSRVIGVPRDFKGYSKVLSCQAEGVTDFMLQKRDDLALLREVKEGSAAPVYHWNISSGKILSGEKLTES